MRSACTREADGPDLGQSRLGIPTVQNSELEPEGLVWLLGIVGFEEEGLYVSSRVGIPANGINSG